MIYPVDSVIHLLNNWDQMSKKEILEYSVKCVVEGVGIRVCEEGATWKIRWEDRGDGKIREG